MRTIKINFGKHKYEIKNIHWNPVMHAATWSITGTDGMNLDGSSMGVSDREIKDCAIALIMKGEAIETGDRNG